MFPSVFDARNKDVWQVHYFFSLLTVELANETIGNVPLGPTSSDLFLLPFADDFTLLASTVLGPQDQLNTLSLATKRRRKKERKKDLGLVLILVS